ncbi:MAG: putative UV endonuclease [uncultured bacterium]|nr:MAG: putative UV endonuclease [uncultured bacterium]HBH18944.1 UV DNA damage repair endonuclease UvsE [Cyanobacteria bacterium UBA9579]
MKHRIGYACINTSIAATTNRTCKLANCTPEKLRELIHSNLSGLKQVIEWNYMHNIFLYRISSVIIPFASHPVNTVPWWEENKAQFNEIGRLIKKYHIRVSMHPGQFVNINSPNPEVVRLSINDLEWHAKFLDSLGCDSTCRLIIHVGGVYGDKASAMIRFIEAYNDIPENIRARLSLENDDKSYNVWDVLNISDQTGIPVVFDVLHHQINNTNQPADDDIRAIMEKCFATWNEKTDIPKIHYSSQKVGAKSGSHADSINMDDFIEFYFRFRDMDFDIMFETKDKERSVIEAFKRLQAESAKGFYNKLA